MAIRARLFLFSLLLFSATRANCADARFDLVGPRIDVQVTRAGVTLPIASVPNLQPGDRLWLHPSLPGSQSVHYLLVCVFLRGNTNPPPPDWFIRIETWNKKVQEEGAFVTVPAEAEQAVLLMAPETGGDFSTLRSAVIGRPGVFVRASQDLILAGFEQARIEKYLASIRRVPATEADKLEKHSDLLARTLALKPNDACFKQPVDTQFTCLTQSGTQTLLDDGHGQSMIATLSSGANSDFITAASYTGVAGGGVYSAYVGAIVDLVRIMGNLHTAKYQYIPAIGFPQGQSLNLRLNTPPSFQNPKSVLVIGLPAVQKAVAPPLRPADAAHVACLLQPQVVLPIEGAPLVFSTSFAHDVVLHLHTPPGAPEEADIPLVPDAFQGGLVLQHGTEGREILHDPLPPAGTDAKAEVTAKPDAAKPDAARPQPMPVMIEGTIQGRWGFDPFVGPTLPLQQLPGTGWHIVTSAGAAASTGLIAGQSGDVLLASTGNACVHTISVRAAEGADVPLTFKPSEKAGAKNDLEVALPPQHEVKPGDLQLNIQQFGEPKPDEVTTRTFAEPAHIAVVEIHAGDRSLVLSGTSLAQVENLSIGDLVFTPQADEPNAAGETAGTLRLTLAKDAPAPPTHVNDKLSAQVTLRDGRSLKVPVVVSSARPAIALLSKTATSDVDRTIALTNPDDLPLSQKLTFTLKSVASFPRNGQIEIETVDGTLRTVLTLAPSGGLVLQDPHTVVATLDPLRSFGPSAFGPVHVRAMYPEVAGGAAPTSDWLPLATLVRLPVLTQIECPGDATQACTLSGSSLYLIQSISTDPGFANPVAVPDGYVGSTLSVPGPLPATVYLRLRDDPATIDPAVIPSIQASDGRATPSPRTRR